MKLQDLKIKLFADGADLPGMLEMYNCGYVSGFTTNPSLMKKAGVVDYVAFAKQAVKAIPDMPLSFEVFSDEPEEMEREARRIASWGKNVFVKIPVTNTKGESTVPLIAKLSKEGVQLNVTAIFTPEQVEKVVDAFVPGTENFVSVFAGRIADAGSDPITIMHRTNEICHAKPGALSLWASCREAFNIVEADRLGVDIITVPNGILKKLDQFGKDLTDCSLDTVRGFYKDASSLGYKIL